jgi:hypothetical protein
MGKVRDLMGEKFGRLTIIKYVGLDVSKKALWECLCDCGTIIVRPANCFTKGHTKSCGCLRKETAGSLNRSHTLTSSKEYQTWARIKARVLNPKNKDFESYSKLGMEESWKNDFMAFYNYVGPCPESVNGEKWSIDRIDTHRGYYPENLRWTTQQLQVRNLSKYSTNTSGVCGVAFRTTNKGRFTYATAAWKGFNKDEHSKSFSVLKYGLLPAFAMACAYRERMIEQLNEKGAGYAANHGK